MLLSSALFLPPNPPTPFAFPALFSHCLRSAAGNRIRDDGKSGRRATQTRRLDAFERGGSVGVVALVAFGSDFLTQHARCKWGFIGLALPYFNQGLVLISEGGGKGGGEGDWSLFGFWKKTESESGG